VSSGPARHRWRLVRVRRLLAAAAVGAALVGLAQPAASARADDVPCDQISTDNTRVRTDRASAPLQLLGVARAQALFADRGRAPGAGANVAVLDSGVYDEDGLIDVAERHSVTGNTELDDYHGTAVAGLIAGRARPDGRAVGIAPGSRIVDVRVYDVAEADPSDPSQHEVTGDAVAGCGSRSPTSRSRSTRAPGSGPPSPPRGGPGSSSSPRRATGRRRVSRSTT